MSILKYDKSEKEKLISQIYQVLLEKKLVGREGLNDDSDIKIKCSKCLNLFETSHYLLTSPSGSLSFDDSFSKDPLLKERIRLIFNSSVDDVINKPYILTDEKNKQYLSSEKGILGGHKKLKIYGRLDCPSALRHIANGKYVRNRVFFKDEWDALLAGYRPCGACMKDEFQLWKKDHEKFKKIMLEKFWC